MNHPPTVDLHHEVSRLKNRPHRIDDPAAYLMYNMLIQSKAAFDFDRSVDRPAQELCRVLCAVCSCRCVFSCDHGCGRCRIQYGVAISFLYDPAVISLPVFHIKKEGSYIHPLNFSALFCGHHDPVVVRFKIAGHLDTS